MQLRQVGRLRLCYAPLEHLRSDARIAVVGLTPGRDTFRASVTIAQEALRAGKSDATALRRAKEAAPFSNPGTRRRLIRWLDDLGVAAELDLDSCADLYESARALVHWTSLVRYPVFRWSERRQAWVNYSGSPDALRHFGDVIRGAFVPEVRRLRADIVFTLGDKVRDTASRLARDGAIEGSRFVALPHPSGQNVGNDEVFARRRRQLRRQVRWLFRHS